MDEDYRRQREAEAARRQASLPAWAEWAAWRWSRGDIRQKAIGAELGGVQVATVSDAIRDYLFISTDAPFWLNAPWFGRFGYDGGWWSNNTHGKERQALLRQHFGERMPAFPGLVSVKRRPDTAERNRWIYRQRQAGRTLAAIGAEAGVSRERVAQICRREAGQVY